MAELFTGRLSPGDTRVSVEFGDEKVSVLIPEKGATDETRRLVGVISRALADLILASNKHAANILAHRTAKHLAGADREAGNG